MIDLWSSLRIPLFVTLAFPSAGTPDPNCSTDLEIAPASWKRDWSPELQEEWIATYLPPLLANKSVLGVFWEHFSDAGPHLYPNSGLMDQLGKPKPALQRITQLRTEYR